MCRTKEYSAKCPLLRWEEAQVRLIYNPVDQPDNFFNLEVIGAVEARKFANARFLPFSNDEKKKRSTHDILQEKILYFTFKMRSNCIFLDILLI
jgi:hypothetical protein